MKKKQKIILIILSVLLILPIGAGMYVFSLMNSIKRTPLFPDEPEVKKPTRADLGIQETAPKPEETGVTNILLFGLDKRSEDEAGRTDSILIASIDRKNKVVKLTSLMRDMYVPIPGKQDNRINTAYAFGGPGLAMKTINQNFDMNIEKFIAIDFSGFEQVIDSMGGIEINVKKAEVPVVKVKGEGLQTLNGKQALAYSRIRKIGNNDFERTERQRTVLNQLFRKAKSTSIFKMPELLSDTLPLIETNMSKSELLMLGKDVMAFNTGEMKEFRLPVEGTYRNQNIRGMAVLVPDIEKNKNYLHDFISEK